MDRLTKEIRGGIAVILVAFLCLVPATLKAGQIVVTQEPQQTSQPPGCNMDSCRAWAHDSCTTVLYVWFDGSSCGATCATNPLYFFGRRGSIAARCQ